MEIGDIGCEVLKEIKTPRLNQLNVKENKIGS
jgi:hypothetical protein